jgi:hypothetical protein
VSPEESNARHDGEGEGWVFDLEHSPRSYNVAEERDAKIVDWRASCFEMLGLDELTSAALAVRRDIDRVQVERMVKAGATAEHLRAVLL